MKRLLIILLSLALVGGGGYFGWNYYQDSKTNNDPSEGGKYLVIKEWGVRFELPEELRGDVTYYVDYSADRDFGGPIKINFTSKKFSRGALKCAVIEDNTSRDIVSFYKQLDSETGEASDSTHFKKIGEARYYFIVTSCEEAVNREGSPQDRELITGLKEAIAETLQAE